MVGIHYNFESICQQLSSERDNWRRLCWDKTRFRLSARLVGVVVFGYRSCHPPSGSIRDNYRPPFRPIVSLSAHTESSMASRSLTGHWAGSQQAAWKLPRSLRSNSHHFTHRQIERPAKFNQKQLPLVVLLQWLKSRKASSNALALKARPENIVGLCSVHFVGQSCWVVLWDIRNFRLRLAAQWLVKERF